MATLLNRTCKECGAKTFEENGVVSCDCMEVDKDAWANGVCETPKNWILPLTIPNKPAFRFVNDGEDVSIRIRQGEHTFSDLIILDMRFEDEGFGWFIHQVLMEDEYQTEPRGFPTLKETINDALENLKDKYYPLWTTRAELLKDFLEINQE